MQPRLIPPLRGIRAIITIMYHHDTAEVLLPLTACGGALFSCRQEWVRAQAGKPFFKPEVKVVKTSHT
jgi:hypothetical protein